MRRSQRFMWHVFTLSFAAALLMGVGTGTMGCEPPRQASFAHVEVAPGVEGRLRWMDAIRLHDEQRQAMTESQEHAVVCGRREIIDDTYSSADEDAAKQQDQPNGSQELTTATVIRFQPCVIH